MMFAVSRLLWIEKIIRLTLNFTTSDSSSDERCFWKVLIVLQLTQLAGSKFRLSITLLE